MEDSIYEQFDLMLFFSLLVPPMGHVRRLQRQLNTSTGTGVHRNVLRIEVLLTILINFDDIL